MIEMKANPDAVQVQSLDNPELVREFAGVDADSFVAPEGFKVIDAAEFDKVIDSINKQSEGAHERAEQFMDEHVNSDYYKNLQKTAGERLGAQLEAAGLKVVPAE